MGQDSAQVAAAQRQLVRIGIDRPASAATSTVGELAATTGTGSYPRRTFPDLAAALEADLTTVVLDVRRDDERHRRHHRLGARPAAQPAAAAR